MTEWLDRATRVTRTPAWSGQEKCRRPSPKATGNVTSCLSAGTPHRHCECGEAIDLDHGYCDDCMKALIRGAAMSEQDSLARKAERLAWLEKFGFIVPDLEALLLRGIQFEMQGAYTRD